MSKFFLIIGLMIISGFVGSIEKETNIRERCIAFYSDMPHNKVSQHCIDLLKFEKK